MSQTSLEERFRNVLPKSRFCSLRFVDESYELVQVRQNVVQPVRTSTDVGAMITVVDGDGVGYAATPDLSESGLRSAVEEATSWAERTRGRTVHDFSGIEMPHPKGEYRTRVEMPWDGISLNAKIDLLLGECSRLKTDERIVDWEASLWRTRTESLYLTSDGGRVEQELEMIVPSLSATANRGSETQTRSLGGRGYCRQGGLEVLDQIRFREMAPVLGAEAVELLEAANCPTGKMHVLLAPDQMILQIHESIGHPLELDRILGDERNYAGTSFVTPDMFGTYRYGSDLLNITFDPTIENQFASYGFDDDGVPARKEYIIEKGILQRGLGSAVSQARTGLPGVANSRACSWNRPPIDRMANLNLEPGDDTTEEMIAGVERGVYMKTNISWSIDDSRNKFQFGCEWGRMIENGKLTTVVKKPNYRGISATFWRDLEKVGNRDTFEVLGTPFCGKGEPNQVVRVGHASPTCLFRDVDVFGGE